MLTRLFAAAFLVMAFAGVARGDDTSTAPQISPLDQATQAVNAMQEVYATEEQQEAQAKSEHDPLRLNCIHQNNARMADLITVAQHDLEDMRLAVSSNQSSEAVQGELEDIQKVQSKVNDLQKEAQRCVGIKVVGADNGEGETTRDFSGGSNVPDDPLASLVAETALPGFANMSPPASPVGNPPSGGP